MNDHEFLALKQRYYSERDAKPRIVETTGTPGEANNQEQFALRWGYERAVEDIKAQMLRSLLGPFGT